MPGVTFTLAVPISHMAAGGGAMRFEHISDERREQFVRDQHEVRQGESERRNAEIRANAQARANGGQPVRMAGGAAMAGRPGSRLPPAYGRPGAPNAYAPRPGRGNGPQTGQLQEEPRSPRQGAGRPLTAGDATFRPDGITVWSDRPDYLGNRRVRTAHRRSASGVNR